MSAAFSIDIILDGRVSFETIINEIDNINIGYRFCLNKIIRIDNWEYQNEIIIPKASYPHINKYLEEGKKIIGYGLLKSSTCGFMMWYEEDITCIDFWISTKYVSSLDSDCINESNIEIYKYLVNYLIEIFINFKVKWCVMGSEIEIPEELSFENTMKNNNMITCFILPKKCEFEKPESYCIKKINEFFVGLNKKISDIDILDMTE